MTDRKYTLRPMVADDIGWIVEQEDIVHIAPWGRNHFSDSLEAGYSCWVIESGGEPVGYAVLMRILDEAHLLNITVAQARQRHGWGALLLGELRRMAYANGARQMFLEVRPSNAPALRLYERSGFVPIGRRRDYYPTRDAGKREDAIVMHRELGVE